MAEAVTVAELRRLIHELEDVEPWSDVTLSARIDAHDGSLNGPLAMAWMVATMALRASSMRLDP